MSPNDTSNFLSFLQELRADPQGQDLILSAATPVLPWKDETGSPSTNVSGFASVLDFITIMNYDVWGHWSATVGPNSPLNDTCAPAADQMGSAVSAVAAWTAAGMPVHQIVLGMATYGHSFTVSTNAAVDNSSGDDSGVLAAYPAFDSTSYPHGDAWDGPGGVDPCGNTDNNWSGNWDYWGLVQEGFLFANGTAQPGIDYRFDECSQTVSYSITQICSHS
jgi:chitinase